MQRDEITEVVFLHIVRASNSTKVKKIPSYFKLCEIRISNYL